METKAQFTTVFRLDADTAAQNKIRHVRQNLAKEYENLFAEFAHVDSPVDPQEYSPTVPLNDDLNTSGKTSTFTRPPGDAGNLPAPGSPVNLPPHLPVLPDSVEFAAPRYGALSFSSNFEGGNLTQADARVEKLNTGEDSVNAIGCDIHVNNVNSRERSTTGSKIHDLRDSRGHDDNTSKSPQIMTTVQDDDMATRRILKKKNARRVVPDDCPEWLTGDNVNNDVDHTETATSSTENHALRIMRRGLGFTGASPPHRNVPSPTGKRCDVNDERQDSEQGSMPVTGAPRHTDDGDSIVNSNSIVSSRTPSAASVHRSFEVSSNGSSSNGSSSKGSSSNGSSSKESSSKGSSSKGSSSNGSSSNGSSSEVAVDDGSLNSTSNREELHHEQFPARTASQRDFKSSSETISQSNLVSQSRDSPREQVDPSKAMTHQHPVEDIQVLCYYLTMGRVFY